jgi:decaprenylphospho-beta-D-ribofuranose 2-oxidase
MAGATSRELSGWGLYPRQVCDVCSPETRAEVARCIARAGTIARGLGRSYGDPALNENGRVIDCTGLDRYIAFDEATSALTCEAGVSLEDVIRDFAPRGYFPMVTPGTKFVTIGGCIANDVHGKAHHADGCFSSSLTEMTLLLGDGSVVRASREERPDLFWATVGGLGLTGIILTATIRLRPIETTHFKQKAIVAKDFDALLEAIHETDAVFPYSVAWIDSLATGARLGRGVLTVGDHAKISDLPLLRRQRPLVITPPSAIVVPFELPDAALNTATVRALNVALAQVQAHGAKLAHYEKFFYPLDVIGNWNLGYGSRGFTQYQFVIPEADGPRRMRAILERIATSGHVPFLNVLKRFGPANEGMLSFPFAGYTFAIDFPVRDGLASFLRSLDEDVLDAGGRVYLGKDAFLAADMLPRMYGRVDEFKAVKAKYDPANVFTSSLARRVGLVP